MTAATFYFLPTHQHQNQYTGLVFYQSCQPGAYLRGCWDKAVKVDVILIKNIIEERKKKKEKGEKKEKERKKKGGKGVKKKKKG